MTKDPNVFDSSKLVGKYKVDLTPVVEDSKDDLGALGVGLLNAALSTIDVEMNFYKNQQGTLAIDGGLFDFANAFSDKPLNKANDFSYKVEQDSILYMKMSNEADYSRWAIVRKFSENYDYLQFLIIENEDKKVLFNLKKLQ